MKCFVLLTFATLCYSYPYGSGYGYGSGSGYGYGSGSGGNININQDGSVYITDANGRRLTVSRGPQQNNGAIAITGYEKYNRNYWYQPSQADALVEILAQYQGDVNGNSYQQLLGDVRAAVQAGQLSNNVYQILQNLNQAQNGAGDSQRIQVSFASKPFQNQVGQSGAQERLQELRQAQQIQQLIQQEQQVQQLLQQQQQQQQFQRNQYVQNQQGRFGVQGQADAYLGAENKGVYGQQQIGKDVGVARSWSAFITDILNGNRQQNVGQYNRYGQQIGQSASNQLSQLAEEERKIQLQQQQQQQQLLEQQLEQQQQQQQQQNPQQDIEEFQQQVQQEPKQVLNQQQRLQQEQEQEQQQQQWQQQQQQFRQQQRQRQQLQQEQQLRNLLNGARVFIGNQGQSSFWQQQPGVYSQRGQYGVNGQVFQRQYAPLVF